MAENDNLDLQRALRELNDIRRVIDRLDEDSLKDLAEPPSQLQLVLHLLLAGIVAPLLLLSWLSHDMLTGIAVMLHADENLQQRFVLIGASAAVLISVALVFYITAWQAARRQGESLEECLRRGFRYVNSLSFSSDLFIKFTALAVVILEGRADWVSPLLIIFTGDYLLQGRLFILPFRLSFLLGFGCIGFGICYLLLLHGTIVWSLAVFLTVNCLSLAHILKLRARAANQPGD